MRVWEALREIPYGETESYGELAERIGQPGSARAVGAANGRNPIAVVVPCHRVIGVERQAHRLRGRARAQAPAARHRVAERLARTGGLAR